MGDVNRFDRRKQTADLLKRFIRFYGPHRKLLVLDLVMAVFQALMGVLIGVILNRALKTYLPANDTTMLGVAIAGIFALSLGLGVGHYVSIRWGHILGARLETDMRSNLFRHLQKLSFSYFDNVKTGHIVSRISNDLFNVSEIAHHAPEDLSLTIFTIIPAAVAMFFFNVPMAVLTLLPLPILFAWGMTYQGRMRSRYRHVRERIADINSNVENAIQGIREIKSFANEEMEIDRFDGVNTEFRFAKEKMYTVMAAFHSTMMFMMNCYPLVVITGGALLVMHDKAQIADILTFSIFVRFIMNPVRRMVNFSEQFQQGAASFERFTEIMDIDPEIQDRPNAIALEHVAGAIKLEDVSFRYSEDSPEVLKQINLDIGAGKTVALVGESGAGKTTLAALIPRFYEPGHGTVSIDGHDVMDIQQASLRDSIGIVRQNAFIFDATIAENILFGRPDASEADLLAAARNANILDFIQSLPDGFDTVAGEHGLKLSGGQRQRLSIARVFLKNPPILIFDEATSSLDTESESLIQNAMTELSQDRTTLIIAHRLTTVKHADCIFVMRQGEIVEQGTHDELIASKGYYHTLHQL